MVDKFREREGMEIKKKKGGKTRQIKNQESEIEQREGEGWAVIKGTGLKWANKGGIKRGVQVKGAIALWQTYCSVNGNTYVNKERPEMG